MTANPISNAFLFCWQVCDGRGDPCDSLCGGAGCGTCGELSCNEGLVQISRLTLKFSNDAETTLKRKEASTDNVLRGISSVKRQSDVAADLAKMAYDASLISKNETDTYRTAVEDLLANITDYFGSPAATPDEIRLLAQEVGIGQVLQVTNLSYKLWSNLG